MQRWSQEMNDPRIHVIEYPVTNDKKVDQKAYKACSQEARKGGSKWLAALELDEFLVLKKHDNIEDFASEHIPEGQLAINLQSFGTSGRAISKPLPVSLRFQCRISSFKKNFIKSIVHVDDLNFAETVTSTCVFPLLAGRNLVDTNGAKVKSNQHDGPR